MSKKDRIAIALSSLYILFPLFNIIASFHLNREGDAIGFLFIGFILSVFLVIYWGVRFIKNDIGFLKKYNDE